MALSDWKECSCGCGWWGNTKNGGLRRKPPLWSTREAVAWLSANVTGFTVYPAPNVGLVAWGGVLQFRMAVTAKSFRRAAWKLKGMCEK